MADLRMEICLLECYEYRAGISSVPLLVALMTEDEEIEISPDLYIDTVRLADRYDEHRWFGYSRSVLSRTLGETVRITQSRPHVLVSNVFGEGDESEVFYPGEYELYVRVTVSRKVGDGVYRAETLEGVRDLTFS